MNKENSLDNETNPELRSDETSESNDSIVQKDYLSTLLDQEGRLIYYEIENIYQNDKKRTYKNKFKLKSDPPVFVIKDEEGNEARFDLTENLTDELIESFKEVKRAYYGFSGPKDMNAPEGFIDKVKYFLKENVFKVLATIFIILFILSLNIL